MSAPDPPATGAVFPEGSRRNASPATPETAPPRSGGLWPALVLAAVAVAIYANSFAVPLLYDDDAAIANNTSIRRLAAIGGIFSPPQNTGVGGRPLLNLSFALNYAFGGTAVFGYHLVNLLIHVLAAWTLYGLVRRTLLRPALAPRFGPSAGALALAISALWLCHPVQTVSVTYLSQRAEALVGLFYLLTLYCFLRGAEQEDRGKGRLWFAFSVLACLAGVGTKEVIVTAPFLALLYDRTFLAGSFAAAWRRRRPVFLGLAGTWPVLAWQLSRLHERVGIGFRAGLSPWAYGWAECRVVVRYLLLTVWPRPLVFDYGQYFAVAWSQLWPFAVVVAALILATLVLLRRSPALGFAAAWFLIVLAPTSSVVPVVPQPMAENRLYLPLAGIVAIVVLGGFAALRRRSLPVFAALALVLGVAAAERNRCFASAESIWTDTVAKNPGNPRAHYNLACVLEQIPGRQGDAIAQYETDLRLDPADYKAHNNLGVVLSAAGNISEAIAHFEAALRLQPALAEAHCNLGDALAKVAGREAEAVGQYEEGLRLNPDNPKTRFDLACVLDRMPGRLADAISQYQAVLRIEPDYPEAHYNLGNDLKAEGRNPAAITEYEAAVRLKPDYAEAHHNLGNALSAAGRIQDAIAEFRTALRLRPDFAETHFNLAIMLLRTPGGAAEAAKHLRAVLQLQPGNRRARQILDAIAAAQP